MGSRSACNIGVRKEEILTRYIDRSIEQLIHDLSCQKI
jgi:hypothetical protein